LIVLDASLAVDWLFDWRPAFARSDVNLSLEDVQVVVPSHWPLEICNTLRPDIRDEKISIADFHAIMERLDLLDIRVEPPIDLDEIGPLSQFSVTHNLTAYDAAYVQLALQLHATLATFDRAMRAAAARLNIPLLPAAAP
jgi:predicted nucleic acid-binding protein